MTHRPLTTRRHLQHNRRVALTALAAFTLSGWLLPITAAEAATQPVMVHKQIRLADSAHTLLSSPYGFVHNNTNYFPIWYVMNALNQFGIHSAWDGTTWSLTDPNSATIPTLPAAPGSKKITWNGVPVENFTGIAAIDPGSGAATQFAPIWDIMQLLKALNIDSIWSGSIWTVTPPTPEAPAIRIGFAADNPASIADAQANLAAINQLDVDNYSVLADGTVTGDTYASEIASATAQHVDVYATVSNWSGSGFSPTLASSVLDSPTNTDFLVQQLVALATSNGYAGINIDFENVDPADGASFCSMLGALQTALHKAGKQLSVDVPAEPNATAYTWDVAYNYADIAPLVDQVDLMTYDYTSPPQPAGPVAPLWWDKQVLTYAESTIPSTKIVLGLPAYGYVYNNSTTVGHDAKLSQIDIQMAEYSVTPQWDAAASTPWYTADGETVYYDNEQSLLDKIQLTATQPVAGIFFWAFGEEDAAFWSAWNTLGSSIGTRP